MGSQLTNEFRYYHGLRNSFSYKLFLCCLVTVGVMYAHKFLPSKTLRLVPGKYAHAYIYGDKKSTGESMVRWLDYESLKWQCDIEDDGKSHVCGFNVALGESASGTGVDLSGYDKVNVDVDYRGTDKRLRFYVRNFMPNFSDQNSIETSQFNNSLIPAKFVNSDLSINFSEMSVAEWWISTYQVPREHMRASFTNVQVFGIDLNYPTTPGKHVFQLKKLEFVGLWVSKERWYLSILIFWMCVIVGGGAYNLWLLKQKYKSERERLEAMVSKNSVLENETNHYRRLSMLDQLTGLLNRHGLSYYIESKINETQGECVSLIIVDIDYFKHINDTYGHNGGDLVLQKMAQLLRENIRATDFAARWGGEEFVLVLPGTHLLEAQQLAENLRVLVANMQFDDVPDLHCTISLGVGTLHALEPFHMLFRRVDIALYQAKAQGRNCVVLAQPVE